MKSRYRRSDGRVVRHGSAKPFTAVRFRLGPHCLGKLRIEIPRFSRDSNEYRKCRGGGTGRHRRLKISRLKSHAGSIPACGTRTRYRRQDASTDRKTSSIRLHPYAPHLLKRQSATENPRRSDLVFHRYQSTTTFASSVCLPKANASGLVSM